MSRLAMALYGLGETNRLWLLFSTGSLLRVWLLVLSRSCFTSGRGTRNSYCLFFPLSSSRAAKPHWELGNRTGWKSGSLNGKRRSGDAAVVFIHSKGCCGQRSRLIILDSRGLNQDPWWKWQRGRGIHQIWDQISDQVFSGYIHGQVINVPHR